MKTIEELTREVAEECFADRAADKLPAFVFVADDDELLNFATKFLEAWQAQQDPVGYVGKHIAHAIHGGSAGLTTITKHMAFDDDVAIYLSPPPAIPDWQPIATAPKDGTRVLLVIDHGEWGDKVWTGLWDTDWMVSYGKARTEPTHWMNLPQPPAQGEKE